MEFIVTEVVRLLAIFEPSQFQLEVRNAVAEVDDGEIRVFDTADFG